MTALLERVVVYVRRNDELLVFDHHDVPEAGTQVPAGGVEAGETVEEAARREVVEETGLEVSGPIRILGTHEHEDGLGRPARSTFVEVDAPAGAPDRWSHVVAGAGLDRDLVFLCRFERRPRLRPVQAVFYER